MRLFAGGAITPLVVKIGTKQPWVKIENLATLIAISRYVEAKFDSGYFIIFFCIIVIRFFTKNFTSFQAKMKV